jgi:hypothetical protein
MDTRRFPTFAVLIRDVSAIECHRMDEQEHSGDFSW